MIVIHYVSKKTMHMMRSKNVKNIFSRFSKNFFETKTGKFRDLRFETTSKTNRDQDRNRDRACKILIQSCIFINKCLLYFLSMLK